MKKTLKNMIACYQAYSKKARDNRAIEKSIIENERMRSKINYEDLIQYAFRFHGEIICGMKIHFNQKNEFDVEKVFKIKKEPGVVEGIKFFNKQTGFKPELAKLFEDFSNYVLKDLKDRGYKTLYGFYKEKIQILYTRNGFEVLEKKVVDNITLLLLRKNL